MNDQIQEYAPEYYQNMYHIKNLQTILNTRTKPATLEIKEQLDDIKLDDNMKVTDMFPVICNGKVFSVVSMKSIKDDSTV